MQKEEVQLNFKFSQPKLIELCYEKHGFATRGVTQIYLDSFAANLHNQEF